MKLATKILIFLVFCLIGFGDEVFAREIITDWYIKNFETEIIVNKDSSLLITEKITADADDLPNKHGIFRSLPTKVKGANNKYIPIPIKLISITDFNGKPLKYKTIKDRSGKVITWKIGDPNKTVKGINYYKIVYKVKNVISFDNPEFDELYWNLLGTFWELEIDNFSAKIILPKEINKENTKVDYYTGYFGSKDKNLADYRWVGNNILEFYSTKPLKKGQGITVSLIFPKNIFTPSNLTFTEKYGLGFFYFVFPLFTFIICFYFWYKYGKDPYVKKPIVPQFEIPENLSPIEMGMFISHGRIETLYLNRYLTASIINLAVNGFIKIEEVKKENSGIKDYDYIFRKTEKGENPEGLNKPEALILSELFPGETKKVLLSSLKNSDFSKKIKKIRKTTINELIRKRLISKKGLSLKSLFLTIGIGVIVIPVLLADISFFSFIPEEAFFGISLSGMVILVFALFMPKRTQKGAEVLWKIKGFKMYMNTAEKYRQRFYEKENIFDKFLPYAIVFGITKRWMQKMEEIYGKDYFASYIPVWFVGYSGGFDFQSFNSAIQNVTVSIAESIGGSSTEFAGGGFAGGGGGGGGGGGW